MSTNSISRRNAMLGLGAGGIAAAGLTAASVSAATATAKPLAGKAAIVSGARNNMGRAFAVALGEMGADVVVHYYREETRDQAEETARLVRETGVRAVLTAGDLGQSENVRRMYDLAETEFGGVDVVVNNAGKVLKKPFAEVTDTEFEELDNVNNRALFWSLREASARLRDGGRIINIGTTLLAAQAPQYALYAGTKAPVEEYTRMLAQEHKGRGITVNTVAPGPIDTPFFHAAETPQSVAYLEGRSVENRLGTIEDVVPLVRFLASPEGRWVNGQTIWINGAFATR